MRIWIMANDREEKKTVLNEYFKARVEALQFCREQKLYHQRNGVKVKIKKFKLGE